MNIQPARQDLDRSEDPRNNLLVSLETLVLTTAEQPGAKPAVEALLRSLLAKLSDRPLSSDIAYLTQEAPLDQADEFEPDSGFDAVELANLLALFTSIRGNVKNPATLIQLQRWRARIREILQAKQGGLQ